ncbi:hypothetical protein ACQEVF_32260 [Nonomuraea polychroma]|uniref:hypothetical protein n=1 Tax=Nonomuraea polychroma TaxID=46176 RepID=UPI003D8EF1FF
MLPHRALAGVVLSVALTTGCGDGSQSRPTVDATPLPIDTGPRLVVYKLGGTGFGDVTLQSATGTEQYTDVELPNETSYKILRGSFAYVSVQNTAAEGSVTCEIVVDGTVISRNSSDGAYVIATCQGSVP